MYNSQGNYVVAFSIYGAGEALTRIEYQSQIKLDSKPSVEEVQNDIFTTFGASVYTQIARIWTLKYTHEDIGVTDTLWFSDLMWEEGRYEYA